MGTQHSWLVVALLSTAYALASGCSEDAGQDSPAAGWGAGTAGAGVAGTGTAAAPAVPLAGSPAAGAPAPTAGAAAAPAAAGTGGVPAAGQGAAGSLAGTGGAGEPPAVDAGSGGVDAGVGTPDAGAGDAGSAGPISIEGFVGNITTNGQVRSDFIQYWNQITPENEGKWGSVEPVRDQMSWAGLDRVHDYAQQNGIPFKQHTMVWGSQQPGWIGGLSQSEQREEVEEWIRLFCERYPDVQLIDVVNEPPPHTTPVYAQALGGAGSSGYDWIVQAFVWTRQYCPDAILILNDYNNIEWQGDHDHFVDIVNRIRNAGAPIDAIGAQAHDAHKLSNDVVQGYLDGLAATGLPIYVSEYDINLSSDSAQREVMARQFPMFHDHPAVKGITLWGYVSGATWLANTGLMSSGGSQRPAMTWLIEYLEQQTP